MPLPVCNGAPARNPNSASPGMGRMVLVSSGSRTGSRKAALQSIVICLRASVMEQAGCWAPAACKRLSSAPFSSSGEPRSSEESSSERTICWVSVTSESESSNRQFESSEDSERTAAAGEANANRARKANAEAASRLKKCFLKRVPDCALLMIFPFLPPRGRSRC